MINECKLWLYLGSNLEWNLCKELSNVETHNECKTWPMVVDAHSSSLTKKLCPILHINTNITATGLRMLSWCGYFWSLFVWLFMYHHHISVCMMDSCTHPRTYDIHSVLGAVPEQWGSVVCLCYWPALVDQNLLTHATGWWFALLLLALCQTLDCIIFGHVSGVDYVASL